MSSGSSMLAMILSPPPQRAALDLDADQSGLIIRRFWIIVHIHCHQLAVDHVDESVSPRDNMVAAFLHLVSVV
jgi:hypothetical protein